MFGFFKRRRFDVGSAATDLFLGLLKNHGVKCRLDDGWIAEASGAYRVLINVAPYEVSKAGASTRLDFVVQFADGSVHGDSCGGGGANLVEAVRDAATTMHSGTLPVVVTALSGGKEAQCDIESWEIGGRPRKVYIGGQVVRAAREMDVKASVQWFEEIKPRLQAMDLPDGMHWIRLYHHEREGGEAMNEAIIDHKTWEDGQAAMADLNWPTADEWYSFRLFLIVTDA